MSETASPSEAQILRDILFGEGLEEKGVPLGAGGTSPSPLTGLDLIGSTHLLRPSDIERYQIEGVPDGETEAGSIERISARHHRIAQLFALGHSNEETARSVGLTPQYLSQLKRSPAFKGLLEQYIAGNADKDHAFQLEMMTLRGKALDRVEEDLANGLIRGKDAVNVLTALSDRTGHGPTSTVKGSGGSPSMTVNQLTVFMEKHEEQRARILREPIDVDAIRSMALEEEDEDGGGSKFILTENASGEVLPREESPSGPSLGGTKAEGSSSAVPGSSGEEPQQGPSEGPGVREESKRRPRTYDPLRNLYALRAAKVASGTLD